MSMVHECTDCGVTLAVLLGPLWRYSNLNNTASITTRILKPYYTALWVRMIFWRFSRIWEMQMHLQGQLLFRERSVIRKRRTMRTIKPTVMNTQRTLFHLWHQNSCTIYELQTLATPSLLFWREMSSVVLPEDKKTATRQLSFTSEFSVQSSTMFSVPFSIWRVSRSFAVSFGETVSLVIISIHRFLGTYGGSVKERLNYELSRSWSSNRTPSHYCMTIYAKLRIQN